MREGVEAALAAARGKGYVAMTEDCASTEARYLAAYLLCHLLTVPLTYYATYLLCRLLAVSLTNLLCDLPPTTEAHYPLRTYNVLTHNF